MAEHEKPWSHRTSLEGEEWGARRRDTSFELDDPPAMALHALSYWTHPAGGNIVEKINSGEMPGVDNDEFAALLAAVEEVDLVVDDHDRMIEAFLVTLQYAENDAEATRAVHRVGDIYLVASADAAQQQRVLLKARDVLHKIIQHRIQASKVAWVDE